MAKVRLEMLPSLAETVDIKEVSEEVIPEGNRSVRAFLKQLCDQYQRFGQIVFDIEVQELTGKVAIFFNGSALELVNGLDSELSDGDTLTFVPIIEGG